MDLTTRARLSIPHSQSFPSRSFHKLLILTYQRIDRMKSTVMKIKQTDDMDHSLAYLNETVSHAV